MLSLSAKVRDCTRELHERIASNDKPILDGHEYINSLFDDVICILKRWCMTSAVAIVMTEVLVFIRDLSSNSCQLSHGVVDYEDRNE